jgi:hypothetical protein
VEGNKFAVLYGRLSKACLTIIPEQGHLADLFRADVSVFQTDHKETY